MAVLSFKDRIADFAGSLGTADDNALQQWLIDGCYDVINKKSKTETNDEFAIKSSSYTSSMTVNLDSIREIVSVERDGLVCQRVPFSKSKFVDPNTTLGALSIYKATSYNPVFYVNSNQLIVKPNPTSSENGYYTYIPEYSITSFDSTSTNIDNFPNQYYEHVILYASYMTLGRQLLDLLEDTTDSSLSMNVISKMMNNDKPNSGGDVWDWLIDEDSDMVGTTVSAIQSATGITKQKYDWYNERMAEIRNLYISKFPVPQESKGGR